MSKPIGINNAQLYALAALYAKKYVSHVTVDSFAVFVANNLESGYYANHSMIAQGCEIAKQIVVQFGHDYQIEEFRIINK